MTKPTHDPVDTLRDHILAFIDHDDDAKLWGMEPDDFADAPDCHIMSDRFVEFLAQRGVEARRLELLTSSSADTMVGPYHAVAEVSGICIDWTARQFYNALYVQSILDASDIPCPLLFVRGGQYPIPSINAEEDVSS